MRVFNRIAVTLLLLGVLVLCVFGVLYGAGLAGYSLSSLPQTLGLSGVVSGAQSLAGGNASPVAIAILAAVLVLGLVLLVAELRPGRPRRVRLKPKGAHATRKAVRERVESAAEGASEVIQAKAKVKSRRRAGARVKLKAGVRRGEDAKSAKSGVKDAVKQGLEGAGVPVGKLKVKIDEVDARGAKGRTR